MILSGTASNILTAIFAVFTMVGEWFVAAVPKLFALFYTDEAGLTLLGVLAVVGLAFSVIFLLIGIIQRFLHFGG